LAPRRPAPEIPPGFEPHVANLPRPDSSSMLPAPGGYHDCATFFHNRPPPRTWPVSPVTYVRREVGAGAMGTRGTLGPTPGLEVGAGAAEIRDALGAALRREVGVGAMMTRDGPGAALSREVRAGAARTPSGPGAVLSREPSTTPPPPPPRLPRAVRAWWYMSWPQIIHIG
jgi:hypothetical protein